VHVYTRSVINRARLENKPPFNFLLDL
jgi:hypothetical protein